MSFCNPNRIKSPYGMHAGSFTYYVYADSQECTTPSILLNAIMCVSEVSNFKPPASRLQFLRLNVGSGFVSYTETSKY
jgi:hypothetical protein